MSCQNRASCTSHLSERRHPSRHPWGPQSPRHQCLCCGWEWPYEHQVDSPDLVLGHAMSASISHCSAGSSGTAVSFWYQHYMLCSWTNTVSTVTTPQDKWSGIWFLAVARNFALFHTVQIGSGDHPAWHSMHTRHSPKPIIHLHPVPRLRMSGAASIHTNTLSWHVQGQQCLYLALYFSVLVTNTCPNWDSNPQPTVR